VKVCLVFPPHWDTPMPPLSIASLTSALRQAGIEVVAKDLNYRYEGGKRFGDAACREAADAIDTCGADLVGLSIGYTNFRNATRLAKALKRSDPARPIVIGGPHVSYLGEEILQHLDCFDIAVWSEGEAPLVEICRRYEQSRRLPRNIASTIARDESGTVVKYPLAGAGVPLDQLPWPDFDDYDLGDYALPLLPLITSRSCPRRCTFCGVVTNNVFNAYRERSVPNILGELQRNVDRYGVRSFLFGDALLNSNFRRCEALMDAIIAEGLGISWIAEVFPRIDAALASKMHRAGCRFVWVSPETGSSATAVRMRKGVKLDVAATSIRNLHEAGIFTSVWFILGFAGESKRDIDETIAYARALKPWMDECTFVPFGLMRGSPAHRAPEEFGIDNVRDYRFSVYSHFRQLGVDFTERYLYRLVEQLWDEFNAEQQYPFVTEKRLELLDLNLWQRMIYRLTLGDCFDKRKVPYQYADVFRRANVCQDAGATSVA
jgi:radical SAM superfamily enzyme YgiQ (UPF0313 family)